MRIRHLAALALWIVFFAGATLPARPQMEQTMTQPTLPQIQPPAPGLPPVWCTHALNNVFRDTPVPVGDTGSLRLSAARNQTVGAQIVFRVGAEPARISGIHCDGLRSDDGKNAIGASSFSCAFIEYCHVEKNSTATPTSELVRLAPADFPDAFSEASEVIVPAMANQPVWVQFRVPANARPGLYGGVIRAQMNETELRIPVNLTVFDFSLPSATRLFVTIWTDTAALAKHQNVTPYTEGWWKLIDTVAAMMQAHHQNVILTPWNMIRATKTADGRPSLDFERFDRWVRVFLNHGFKRIEISHIGGREHGEWEDKTFVAYDMPCESPDGQKLSIEEWLPMLQSHLEEQGWLDRAMIHVADEPIPVNLASWKELSARVHRAAPRLRRIDAVHVADLANALEVWVPQLNFLEQWLPRFKEAQQKGAELWYYTAWVPQGRYPNRLMDYPLIKTRILHWINYTSGTTGYLHWGWNFWDVKFDQFAPGDNWIVWPGTSGPRSSLRYEAMREGIEDYEYLCMFEDSVRQAARKHGAKGLDARQFVMTFAQTLVPGFQEYSRNPAVLYGVREAVGRSIEALKGTVPVAALARRTGADVEVNGFAPPGAMLAIGDAQTVADAGGLFNLAATAPQSPVNMRVELGGRVVTVRVPVMSN